MPRSGTTRPVVAVVVTYNRLDLLKRCIEALRDQTEDCDILIVNNASTDGTAQWLIEQQDLNSRNTGSNLGGTGGFNYGMRWAVETGYDYVWVMDDDTLPESDALEKLMEADRILEGNCGWLSSKCRWTDGTLCPMNLQRVSPYKEIHLEETSEGILFAQMASFVSLFLRRDRILEHGLPVRDFFIWTDDWEYTRRISKTEACYVVVASSVVHAMNNKSIVNIARDSTFDTQWQSAYARAEEYYRQNGNLNIPYVYCTSDGYQLGKWLTRQKSAKKAPGKQSNCVMTPERIQKLERIGVMWDAAE